MSKYTTGEMAKLCGVSVRTVQYYDSRNILTPSELSEGGRRLYSEDDLKRLKLICFLRGIGLPINSISEILAAGNSDTVVSMLLEQQAGILRTEIREREAQLHTVEELNRELKSWSHLSVETLSDIAYIMENKKKLRKLHGIMIVIGIVMDVIEIGTLLLWILKGIWLPFAIGMLFVVILGITVFLYYHNHASYICPECHEVFRSKMKEDFFAAHTARTRKLTCPKCGYHGFCIETYEENSGGTEDGEI